MSDQNKYQNKKKYIGKPIKIPPPPVNFPEEFALVHPPVFG